MRQTTCSAAKTFPVRTLRFALAALVAAAALALVSPARSATVQVDGQISGMAG